MTLIVHGAAFSTCTQRVLTTLAELGVDDYKLEPVDMMKGQHKSPDFLKLQPFGQIPVLKDGDLTIFESRAIVRYLVEKYENTTLTGKTLAERAVVNQWWEVESQNFNPPTASIVFQVVFTPIFGLERDDKVVAEQVAKLEKVLDVYEARLSSSKYLAGDSFTLADLSHLPYANLLVTAAGKSELFTSRPHLSAWWKDISSRPTFQKVLALQKQ
jgi:glutathione S-transferase